MTDRGWPAYQALSDRDQRIACSSARRGPNPLHPLAHHPTLPLLIPIAMAFDWNLTWFGVLMAMNIAIGQFTPPVAVNLMVTAKIAQVPIESTIIWALWMMLSMSMALGLLIMFPQLALWLPEVLGYRV